jgi:flagellar biosynthesis protein
MDEDKGRKRQAAVALNYERGKGELPRIAASGYGKLAEKIMRLAFENGVKVREDADLVEVLARLDLGEEIPLEAVEAVAEILAYVYRANGKLPPRPA